MNERKSELNLSEQKYEAVVDFASCPKCGLRIPGNKLRSTDSNPSHAEVNLKNAAQLIHDRIKRENCNGQVTFVKVQVRPIPSES